MGRPTGEGETAESLRLDAAQAFLNRAMRLRGQPRREIFGEESRRGLEPEAGRKAGKRACDLPIDVLRPILTEIVLSESEMLRSWPAPGNRIAVPRGLSALFG